MFRTSNETLFVSYLVLKIVIVVHDVDPDILTSKACKIRMQMKREKKFLAIMFPCLGLIDNLLFKLTSNKTRCSIHP